MSDRERPEDIGLAELIEAFRGVIGPAMGRSAELRRAVGLLGKWLVAEAARAGGDAEHQSKAIDAQASDVLNAEQADAPIAAATAPRVFGAPRVMEAPGVKESRGMVPLKLGGQEMHVEVRGTTEEIGRARAAAEEVEQASAEEAWWEKARGVDLGLVEERSRLKARSCELYADRVEAAGDQERWLSLNDEIVELLRRGREKENCFLWVLWREREQPAVSVVRRIGACYAALAEAASVVRMIDQAGEKAGPGMLEEAMQLLAEADSALRVALEETWLTIPDRDQDEAHLWLRRETAIRRIFLPRHMRVDDPGDPGQAGEMIERARRLREEASRRIESAKEVEATLKRLRYHSRQAAVTGEEYQFERVVGAIEALGAMGVAGRDRRVVEALGRECAERMPQGLLDRTGVREAVEAAMKPRESPEAEPPRRREWSPRVAEARRLLELEGRSVVVVGGEPRQEAIERLKDAFGLSGVEWVRLTEHGSGEAMRAPIARPETAAVVVLVKLAGHLHVEEARRYARAAGKRCVMLPAGYNPEQVAEEMLQQAGERVEA